jgi:hypothetical protein
MNENDLTLAGQEVRSPLGAQRQSSALPDAPTKTESQSSITTFDRLLPEWDAKKRRWVVFSKNSADIIDEDSILCKVCQRHNVCDDWHGRCRMSGKGGYDASHSYRAI